MHAGDSPATDAPQNLQELDLLHSYNQEDNDPEVTTTGKEFCLSGAAQTWTDSKGL